jgi:hypothetical protein
MRKTTNLLAGERSLRGPLTVCCSVGSARSVCLSFRATVQLPNLFHMLNHSQTGFLTDPGAATADEKDGLFVVQSRKVPSYSFSSQLAL